MQLLTFLCKWILRVGLITAFRPFRRKCAKIWVLGLLLKHSFSTLWCSVEVFFFFFASTEFIELILFYLGQVRAKCWNLANSKPLHYTHSSQECKKILRNFSLHKGTYSLCIQIITVLDTELPLRQPGHLPIEGCQTWTSVTETNVTEYISTWRLHLSTENRGKEKKKLCFQVYEVTSAWVTDACATRVLNTMFSRESNHLQKTLPGTMNRVCSSFHDKLFSHVKNPIYQGLEWQNLRAAYAKVRQPKAFRDTELFVPQPKSWCLDLIISVWPRDCKQGTQICKTPSVICVRIKHYFGCCTVLGYLFFTAECYTNLQLNWSLYWISHYLIIISGRTEQPQTSRESLSKTKGKQIKTVKTRLYNLLINIFGGMFR